MNINSTCRSWIRGLAAICLVSSTTACYVTQSVVGHLTVMSKRKPIERVLKDPAISPALRRQLESVIAIRDFASRELGLPDNGSYRNYADVGRQYVVWNVVAAPEFSVAPRLWCYPVVGCVAYRGYFTERRARLAGAGLIRRGFEVSVGGVAAYSTLGHFDDPILNTMLSWDDVELAGIVFHELTHQLIYLSGDASFSEALATCVEEEGVRRWLSAKGRVADLARYERRQARERDVVDLLRRAREELRTLYALDLRPDTMRQAKREALARLREKYARLRAESPDDVPVDWPVGDLNNAQLASIATYYDCVPGLQRELANADGDLGEFYARVRRLAKTDRKDRESQLCGTPRL